MTSLAARYRHAQYGPLFANVTSSIKPEVIAYLNTQQHGGRGQASYFGPGARHMDDGSTETGCGYWGSRGQPASSPPARESGERCKLPQRGPGRAPAAKRFSCILEAPDSLSCNLLGTEFGDMLLCPLEPAYAQKTRSIALTSAIRYEMLV